MKVINLFSKRNRPKADNNNTLFDINYFPQKLKVQILHIINDEYNNSQTMNGGLINHLMVNNIIKIINHEYGIYIPNENKLIEEFERTDDVYFLYDFIELFFSQIESKKVAKVKRKASVEDQVREKMGKLFFFDTNKHIDEIVEELNTRFKENGVGARYESGKIFRISDDYSFAEVIQPTMQLISNRIYSGANDEFVCACNHFKYGRNKECLNECLKAFESTMKCICIKRRWKYDKNKDTSSKLLEILFSHKLIPDYMQSQFSGFRTLLSSGVPTIRNRESGHGQGRNIKVVDDHFASYSLNLTASNILLLVNAEKVLK